MWLQICFPAIKPHHGPPPGPRPPPPPPHPFASALFTFSITRMIFEFSWSRDKCFHPETRHNSRKQVQGGVDSFAACQKTTAFKLTSDSLRLILRWILLKIWLKSHIFPAGNSNITAHNCCRTERFLNDGLSHIKQPFDSPTDYQKTRSKPFHNLSFHLLITSEYWGNAFISLITNSWRVNGKKKNII